MPFVKKIIIQLLISASILTPLSSLANDNESIIVILSKGMFLHSPVASNIKETKHLIFVDMSKKDLDIQVTNEDDMLLLRKKKIWYMIRRNKKYEEMELDLARIIIELKKENKRLSYVVSCYPGFTNKEAVSLLEKNNIKMMRGVCENVISAIARFKYGFLR